MRRKLIISSIILITIVAFTGCELFLEKPPKPTIYVLSVGIDYANTPKIKDLLGTVPDAKEFAAALYYRGAEMKNSVKITLMLQEGSTLPTNASASVLYPTKENIINQIERIGNLVSENDIFLFYYAGHGYDPPTSPSTPSQAGFLVPASLSESISMPVLEIETLRSKLQTIKGTKILILDSCYSGAHEVDYPRSFEAQSASLSYNPSQFYLLASSAQELAWETTHEDHHGYLTLTLLESLGWQHDKTTELLIFNPLSDTETKTIKGHILPGSKAPVERNGSIMLGDIFSYIPAYKKGISQTPQTGSGPLDMVLFSNHW